MTTPLNKEQFAQWCKEIAEQINNQIKDMDDESAQNFIDAISDSFLGMQLGVKNEDHK